MERNISELKGKIITDIQVNEQKDRIVFRTSDLEEYLMYHSSDCCESVSIEEIIGDLKDLIGAPILHASEETNSEEPKPDRDYVESFTWTFYKLATIKGSVTLRWLGESNGYYSESVSFLKLEDYNERGY